MTDTKNPARRLRHGARPAHELYFGPETGQPRRWAALITSAGHGVLQEYGSKFEHALPGQEVIDVVEMVAGSPAIAPRVLDEIDFRAIWDSLGGNDGYAKTFGYYQFGFAVQDAVLRKSAPAIANKAAEEGELTDDWIMDAYQKIVAYPERLTSGDFAAAIKLSRHAIAADRAARPVANKAEVEQDAARYQFLRNADLDEMKRVYWPEGEVPSGVEFDAAIDSAMGIAAPSAPVGATVDSDEFDELLSDYGEAFSALTGELSTSKIIAHIDQHVASQVQAARDAALEEAARACEAQNDTDWPTPLGCRAAIRALKGRPAISRSGEGAAQAGQVAVLGWISVDERLPGEQGQDSEEVLCFLSGHCAMTDFECRDGAGWGIRLGYYDADKGMFRTGGRPDESVTHWMPLPASPASESLRSPQEAAGTEKGESK